MLEVIGMKNIATIDNIKIEDYDADEDTSYDDDDYEEDDEEEAKQLGLQTLNIKYFAS